ncbi:putative electron transfer flavoprotein FixA [Campylobacter pinnipediorum]|uniref:putative electron transfer flavoprotein FixA n=1 Tax=Campylobacter pinnipediorum TaxID=1965231 RepID=UPI00084D7606|nr:putative electron transfer flavoprotein FixA [Campylobacter pinnipediorum]AQW84077.1 electron transfer flavoprotein FixA [Campylobacter pinnipediorum subsp. pinnipediorum]
MNIIVGCKVVLEEQDISINSDRTLDFSKANPKINPFDLNAIQTAVDIKSMVLDEVNIKVLSIGGKNLENTKVKKDILSRGADELNIVIDDKFDNLLAHDTAEIFKQASEKIGFDLIVCADGSADLFASQVGLRAGALLDIPVINSVSKILSIDISSSKIMVQRKLENEIEELELSLPALICVSTDINEPSIPGMKAILAAAKKPVNVLSFDCSMSNIVELVNVSAPKKKDRLGVVLQDDSEECVVDFISNFKKVLN